MKNQEQPSKSEIDLFKKYSIDNWTFNTKCVNAVKRIHISEENGEEKIEAWLQCKTTGKYCILFDCELYL